MFGHMWLIGVGKQACVNRDFLMSGVCGARGSDECVTASLPRAVVAVPALPESSGVHGIWFCGAAQASFAESLTYNPLRRVSDFLMTFDWQWKIKSIKKITHLHNSQSIETAMFKVGTWS